GRGWEGVVLQRDRPHRTARLSDRSGGKIGELLVPGTGPDRTSEDENPRTRLRSALGRVLAPVDPDPGRRQIPPHWAAAGEDKGALGCLYRGHQRRGELDEWRARG